MITEEEREKVNEQLKVRLYRLFSLPNHDINKVSVRDDPNCDTAMYIPTAKEVVITNKLINNLLTYQKEVKAADNATVKGLEAACLHEGFHSIMTKHWVLEKSLVLSCIQNLLEDVRINKNVGEFDRSQEAGFNFLYKSISCGRDPEKLDNPLDVMISYIRRMGDYARTRTIQDFIEDELAEICETPLDTHLVDKAGTVCLNSASSVDIYSKQELAIMSKNQTIYYNSMKETVEKFFDIKEEETVIDKLKGKKVVDIKEVIEKLLSMREEAEKELQKKWAEYNLEQLIEISKDLILKVEAERASKEEKLDLLVIDTIIRNLIREKNKSKDKKQEKEEEKKDKKKEQGEPEQDPKDLEEIENALKDVSSQTLKNIRDNIKEGKEVIGKKRETLKELIEAQRSSHVKTNITPEQAKKIAKGAGGLAASKGDGSCVELEKIRESKQAIKFVQENKLIVRQMKKELSTITMVEKDDRGMLKANNKRGLLNSVNASKIAQYPLNTKENPIFRRPSKGKVPGERDLDLDELHILLDSSGSMSGTEKLIKKFLGSLYVAAKMSNIPTSLVATDNGAKIYGTAKKNESYLNALTHLLKYNAQGGTDFGKTGVDTTMKLMKQKGAKTRVLGITDCMLPSDDVDYLNKTSKKFGAPCLIMAINGEYDHVKDLHRKVKDVPIVHLAGHSDQEILNFFGACFDWMKDPDGFIRKNGTYLDTTDYRTRSRAARQMVRGLQR